MTEVPYSKVSFAEICKSAGLLQDKKSYHKREKLDINQLAKCVLEDRETAIQKPQR